MKKITFLIFGFISLNISSQKIQMEFPYLKGKTYEFIIFQGTEAKVINHDVIPENGKFTLNIPKEYAPYTGMSRWIVSDPQNPGNLNMIIPGHDFSVSCVDIHQNDDNIIFKNNQETSELTTLYKKHAEIFSKYNAMLQAVTYSTKKDKQYKLYQKEFHKQIQAYELLQQELSKKSNYASKFINYIHITQGIATRIFEKDEDKVKSIADYVAADVDWQALYTSGYWNEVIATWVNIHTQFLKNPKKFTNHFSLIKQKMKNPLLYTDFFNRVVYELNILAEDSFLKQITEPIAKNIE